MSGNDQTWEDKRRWYPVWSRAFGLVCGAYVIGLLMWCAWSLSGVPDAFVEGDGAILELFTLHASRGQWALGPYSRFGWYHPGPFYIYLLVPFYVASGHHPLALTVGAIAINVAAFAIIVWTLCRHASGAMTVAVVGALVVYLLRVPTVVTSDWNPHVLLLPYAAVLVSGAAVASGRLSMLPLLALLATFITQTHVGLTPAAVVISGCALIAGVVAVWAVTWRRRPRRQDGGAEPDVARRAQQAERARRSWLSLSKWLAVTAMVLFVVWLPPLYDECAGTGNIGKLLAFFGQKSMTPSRRDTFAAWTGMLLQPLTTDFTAAGGGALPPMPRSAIVGWVAIGEVVLLGVVSLWAARRGRLVEAWLCRLSALASVVAYVAIGRIRGGLVDHLTFWNTMTGMLNAAALLGVWLIWLGDFLSVWLVRLAPVTRLTQLARVVWLARVLQRARPWSSALVPIACSMAVFWLAYDCAVTLDHRRALFIARPADAAPVSRLYLTTRGAIARARLHRPLVEVRGAWADAAGMLVQFDKHGVPVGVEQGVAWLYGAPIASRGDEDGAVSIADADNAAVLARNGHECLVAAANGTFVFLRADTPEQYLQLRCASFQSVRAGAATPP